MVDNNLSVKICLLLIRDPSISLPFEPSYELLKCNLDKYLLPEEIDRINRFYRKEEKCMTVISTLLQKAVLSKLINKHELDVHIHRPRGRKPYCQELKGYTDYNVSHDGNSIGIVWTESSEKKDVFVGLDIMEVRLRLHHKTSWDLIHSLRRQLTSEEYLWVLSHYNDITLLKFLDHDDNESDLKLLRFFMIWTAKEAYVKALGCGISFELSSILVEPDDTNNENIIKNTNVFNDVIGGITLEQLPPLKLTDLSQKNVKYKVCLKHFLWKNILKPYPTVICICILNNAFFDLKMSCVNLKDLFIVKQNEEI